MKLPDFSSDPQLARLRELIGATETIDIPGPTWDDWDGFGIDLKDISLIKAEPDGTLSYKDKRVLVYIRDQRVFSNNQESGYRYHIAECKTLQGMRRKSRFGRYVVTTRTDGFFEVNQFRGDENIPVQREAVVELRVCKNCLKEIDWKSYTTLSKSLQEACWNDFNPGEFLDLYGSRVKGLPRHTPKNSPLNSYPENWAAISYEARKRVEYKCQECDLDLSLNPYFLEVHHLNHNKSDCSQANLMCLCVGCHSERHDHLSDTDKLVKFQEWLKRHPES